MNYSTEAKYPLLDSGTGNWGAVLNAIFTSIDSGIEFTLVSGEGIAQYDSVCMKADGKMWKAKSDVLSTMILVGMAPVAVTVGLSGKMRWAGWIENAGWSWTPGDVLYLSNATAGLLTATQPSTNALPVAVAKTATRIVIYPSIFHPPRTGWKDFSALAGIGFTNWSLGTNGLNSATDAQIAVFPIRYEANSVLTRLRIKYAGSDASTGVLVTLRKKDESGVTTTYTTVGAQQTMLNSGAVVTIYDFADETMAANLSYEIVVESEVPGGQNVTLYSVGIETSKREK